MSRVTVSWGSTVAETSVSRRQRAKGMPAGAKKMRLRCSVRASVAAACTPSTAQNDS